MSADLWSLGVLTFKLLTGNSPFYQWNKKKTRKMILNFENKSLAFPESISPRARNFIERLIRKNPSERMKVYEALRHPLFEGVEDDPTQ
jgi:serine/threonine protein kinase